MILHRLSWNYLANEKKMKLQLDKLENSSEIVSVIYSLNMLQGLDIINFQNKFSFSRPAITCSKLTIETLQQDGKYLQS